MMEVGEVMHMGSGCIVTAYGDRTTLGGDRKVVFKYLEQVLLILCYSGVQYGDQVLS